MLLVAGCVAPTSDGPDPDAAPTGSTAVASSSEVTAATTATTSETVVPPLDATFADIADRTTMTEEARRLLALSNPELVDLGTLGSACTLDPEISVLGCYRSGQIAVLAVDDPRLDGMVEATTAHELLHVAWASLEPPERERLGALLRTAFDRVATTELTERLELYRVRDPATVDGELHSILGTETADVGPDLESYYRRWFADRSAVVSLTVAVRTTFDSLERQVDDFDARLGGLRSRIEAQESALEADRAALEARLAELDALRASGRIEEYNAAVGPFNEEVRLYNESLSQLQALIDEFNVLVQERNSLAAAYTDLVAQVTTTAEPLSAG